MLLRTKPLDLFFLVFIVSILSTSSDVPRPRGVPLQHASLYHPKPGTQHWVCLDGSKSINFLQINDDYCDCADGSDEPGTSACSNGFYHCENVGHRGLDLPSSRVNDGICDCCDGTDEYVNSNCPNTCEELGKAEQEELKTLAELHKRGTAKRVDLITRGRQLRAERETRRAELELRRNEQQAVKEEKQNLLRLAEAAESEALEAYRVIQNEREGIEAAAKAQGEDEPQAQRVEAEAHFVRYDTNKDGLVEVSELQIDMTLDRDRNGVVTVEEAKYFLDERDRIDLDAFVALSWPRIKPLKMLAEGLFKPPKAFEENSQENEHHEEEGHQQEEHINEAAEDDHDADHIDDVHPDDEEHEEYEDEADVGVGTATPEEKPPVEYDPETQRLVDLANEARRAAADVDSELSQTEQEIKEIDEYNNKDYGSNDEYASMDGECFTYEDREYVYTLCPFDRASQKSRSGGSETTLGRWDQWIADGNNKYGKQKYSHGSSCWNGPQRSATISLRCGLETKITAVSEPNRCEYSYDVETPAACDELPYSSNNEKDAHDEL